MNAKLNLESSIVGLVLLLIRICRNVNGQCTRVRVSNAIYQTDVEGQYTLVENALCGGKRVWIQERSSEGPAASTPASINTPCYIYSCPTQASDDVKSAGATTEPSDEWWFIGATQCSQSSIYVEGKQAVSYPYNVPAGSWFELDTHGEFVTSSSFIVTCYSDEWSIWLVAVLLVASLIISVIIVLFLVRSLSRRHRHASQARRVSTTSTMTMSTQASRDSMPRSRAHVTVIIPLSWVRRREAAGPPDSLQNPPLPIWSIEPPQYSTFAPKRDEWTTAGSPPPYSCCGVNDATETAM